MIITFSYVVFFVKNDCCAAFICRKIIIASSSLRFFKEALSAFDKLSFGSFAFCRVRLTLALMVSPSTLFKVLSEPSTFHIISFIATLFGVIEKFIPFDNKYSRVPKVLFLTDSKPSEICKQMVCYSVRYSHVFY